MPIISRFLGISTSMYYLDHDPPHFHIAYGGFRATVGIGDGVVRGQFPRRAAAHAREWLALHRAELETNWERARRGEPLLPITPLE